MITRFSFTLKGLMKGNVMAKMLRYCSSTNEEYTSGSRFKVERNSRILGAIETVADILDKLSKTPGRSLYIVSFISKADIVRATTHVLAVSKQKMKSNNQLVLWLIWNSPKLIARLF